MLHMSLPPPYGTATHPTHSPDSTLPWGQHPPLICCSSTCTHSSRLSPQKALYSNCKKAEPVFCLTFLICSGAGMPPAHTHIKVEGVAATPPCWVSMSHAQNSTNDDTCQLMVRQVHAGQSEQSVASNPKLLLATEAPLTSPDSKDFYVLCFLY